MKQVQLKWRVTENGETRAEFLYYADAFDYGSMAFKHRKESGEPFPDVRLHSRKSRIWKFFERVEG
jgi:hypothetical protein